MTLLIKQSADDKRRLEDQVALLEGQKMKDQAEIATLKKAAAASAAAASASAGGGGSGTSSTPTTPTPIRSFAMADLESRAKLDREEIVALRR